jgi:hypothetical protein
MKKLLNSLVALLLVLAFTACVNRDPLFDGVNCTGNCYVLTGKIYDPALGTGLSKVDLRFYFKQYLGMASNRTEYLGKATTDANGNYRFTFDGTGYKDKMGSFYIEANKDDMFYGHGTGKRLPYFDLDSAQYNVAFNHDYPLYRPATIKINVTADKLDIGHYITVTRNYGQGGYGETINGTGGPVNKTFTFKTAGGVTTYVNAIKTDTQPHTVVQDSVKVEVNATRQINIRL